MTYFMIKLIKEEFVIFQCTNRQTNIGRKMWREETRTIEICRKKKISMSIFTVFSILFEILTEQFVSLMEISIDIIKKEGNDYKF